ncbi:MAG: 4-hydroxythreonine-4-phosphate dehydrogenase PdxA [Planctomycetes bacterium]|nr:4-hydroxythreonine-4-phosphate dehydrogenase PdxA [Planctomycetota bacterium]
MPAMLPQIALTMGDVAGVGPEVLVRAWHDGRLCDWCRPIVFGNVNILRRAIEAVRLPLRVAAVDRLDQAQPAADCLPCWDPNATDLDQVPVGVNDPRAGRAAFDWLVAAAKAALARQVDAIATAPLSKAALHLAGLNYPGHTEILAEICGVRDFAMMLYLPGTALSDRLPQGLGVAHTTLHTSIRSVPELLTRGRILETIGLLDTFLGSLGIAHPRIGVCALNPHAGEEGLFGDEEAVVIRPAVTEAVQAGVAAAGPYPADSVFQRAVAGEFDGVVAMYHDQGHIALKLLGMRRAVNVTLGLPIVRTSPSHGTAFDIAWTGKAQADGMIEAIRVATTLATQRFGERPA